MTTDNQTGVPDACTLPTVQRPLRLAEFDDLFATALLGQQRLSPTQLRWRLDPAAESSARDLTARESSCCFFFSFTIAPDEGAVRIDVQVPATHVEILDALANRAAAELAAHPSTRTCPSTSRSRYAPRRASSAASSPTSTGPRPSNGSWPAAMTSSPPPAPSRTSCRYWPNASPGNVWTPWPASKATTATGNRSCCCCAPTTPAARRWPSDSSPNSPATARGGLVRRLRTWPRDQPGGDRRHGRTRHRHHRRVPEAVD